MKSKESRQNEQIPTADIELYSGKVKQFSIFYSSTKFLSYLTIFFSLSVEEVQLTPHSVHYAIRTNTF